MASKILSRLPALTLSMKFYLTSFSYLSSRCNLMVEHDRQNRRFTVTPSSGTAKQRDPGSSDHCAVLHYTYTGEKEVDLMSTYVPESFRGKGVAAVLSQAAMDFLVEENLKAHVSCWYIKKYIEDHPLQHYKELVIS